MCSSDTLPRRGTPAALATSASWILLFSLGVFFMALQTEGKALSEYSGAEYQSGGTAAQPASGGIGTDSWMGAVRFFPGTPVWQWWRHVWSDNVVRVSCPFQDFQVYTAETALGLQGAKERQQPAYCGLMRLLRPKAPEAPCMVSLPPFRDAFVAVESPASWLSGSDASTCTFEPELRFSPWRPLLGAAGAALFLNAEFLGHSLTFRLAAGTATFVLLSALIAAYVLYRNIPSKRLLAALSVCLAAFPVLLRQLVSVWIPSALEVTGNQIFLGYVTASALVGLAITYYFDSPGNAKLLTILANALRLLGLALVYCSQSAAPEISGAAAAALAGYRLLESPWGRAALRAASGLLSRVRSLSRLRRFPQQGAWAAGGAENEDRAEEEEADTGVAAVGMGTSDEGGQHWRQEVVRRRRPSGRRLQPRQTPLHEGLQGSVQPAGSPDKVRYAKQPVGLGSGGGPSTPRTRKTPLHEGLQGSVQPAGSPDKVRYAMQPVGISSPVTRQNAAARAAEQTPPVQPRRPLGSAPQEESPLVRRGLILNVQTGRTIKIGAGTYNQLTLAGYLEDRIQGTLTSPPPHGRGRNL